MATYAVGASLGSACGADEPHFAVKSLYLVFALQLVLAWIVSLPLLAILNSSPLRSLDIAGACLWLAGFAFEAGGDRQLARFQADPGNQDKVMDRGFWRFLGGASSGRSRCVKK
jgi:steroid 5-alpha reductase family enzyme